MVWEDRIVPWHGLKADHAWDGREAMQRAAARPEAARRWGRRIGAHSGRGGVCPLKAACMPCSLLERKWGYLAGGFECFHVMTGPNAASH